MNANTDSRAIQPDYEAIKTKQKATWASGDYAIVGSTLQITGEQLAESLDMRSGQRVLDVAAGNGNATIAAARRFCNVTSTDYVTDLLERGRERAQANGYGSINFEYADAENLPFADQQFDHVVSTFGVMFAPNQSTAAAELIRVCTPGGRIGMANWTPVGFIGGLFKTIGKHVPPPAGVQSPSRWGTMDFLEENFSRDCSTIHTTSRMFNFRYPSIAAFVDLFKNYYGPVHKAFEAAPQPDQLEAAIVALAESHNTATDGTMVVPSEYLEVVITR